LTTAYPDFASEYAEGGVGRFNYPRPISEPPSPLSSRHTTPAASVYGSEDEDEDEVDEEKEVSSSNNDNNNKFIINCKIKKYIKLVWLRYTFAYYHIYVHHLCIYYS